MKIDLAYGKTSLRVELPDNAHVLRPAPVRALADPAAAIREALRRPIGCAALRERVTPGDSVAIVFSDITRPTPNHVLIPALLAELAAETFKRAA